MTTMQQGEIRHTYLLSMRKFFKSPNSISSRMIIGAPSSTSLHIPGQQGTYINNEENVQIQLHLQNVNRTTVYSSILFSTLL